MTPSNFQSLANFIWSVADLLRGPYRPPQYERVMLPLTVLRRFDAVLASTKDAVLKRYEALKDKEPQSIDGALIKEAKDEDGKALGFYNHSQLDFRKLKGDPDNIGRHLIDYISGFSENIRKIFERFEFEQEIEKLEEANRLYQVISQFAEIDLHPRHVDNITMGLVFEDLIRRFNEAANETAGDHFTPREVIRLMVNLLLEPDTEVLTREGMIVEVYDPTCGTGGMLAESQNWILAHNPKATVYVYGQDYNPRSYAIATSDLLIKGHRDGRIKYGNTLPRDYDSRIEYGNTLIHDQFSDKSFDYLLANPPFGVDWKSEKKEIDRWPDFRGYKGKLPRINDGALLFLIHMVAKFQPWEKSDPVSRGSRAAIVFNGSPLFTGGAGSGESDIRRWIIKNDWLEAIVALPEQMFYNTGIGTFVWLLSNRKTPHRKGKIQLIDARERWTPMKRSLGDKRRWLDEKAIDQITREHGDLAECKTSKVFDNTDFGYRRVTIQRPLRLRFQITREAKERYLDTFPELLDMILAIEEALGSELYLDWNTAWDSAQEIAKDLPYNVAGWAKGAKGTAQKKAFREAFTEVDPDAAPVITKSYKAEALDRNKLFPGQTLPELQPGELEALLGLHPGENGRVFEYEADPNLKDFENIPLKQDIVRYVLREVRPYVSDAWIDLESTDEQDGGIGKVGYEINFNREFFQYQPPRSLREIDEDLEIMEKADYDGIAGGESVSSSIPIAQVRLKYAASINDESITETTDPDHELQYIDIGNVDSHGKVHNVVAYKFEDAPSRARRIARHGDVIISTVRTYLQAIAPIENPPENLVVSTGFSVVRPNGNLFDARFCKYALREKRFLWEVEGRSTGVSYPAIDSSDLADIKICLPTLETQRLIADYLDRETARIDALVAEKERMLKLLEERRAALITAAVTGQIPPEEMHP